MKFNLNISKYIGVVHLSGMIIENTYGFIIPKHSLFDKLYIITLTLIPFSWIICKDECIISYLIKKYENPNYVLGNEPENINDITNLFINKTQYIIFCNTNYVLRLFSILIVNNRTTQISEFILVPTIMMYSFYIYDIINVINTRKKMYPYFQIILSIYLLTVFYKTIITF